MSLEGQYDDDNVFAKMLRGDIPAVKVYEDEAVLAIMDIYPQTPGHTLVIPKEPARNLIEMSDDGAAEAIKRVRRIARAVADAFTPDGVIVSQFNGAPAGQTIFHVHFHIIPRYDDQDVGRHSSGDQADTDALEAQAQKIRKALG